MSNRGGGWLRGNAFIWEKMEGLLVVGPDGKSTFNRLKKPAQRATWSRFRDHLAEELRTGDVAVLGSGEYADWSAHLLPWEECRTKLTAF